MYSKTVNNLVGQLIYVRKFLSGDTGQPNLGELVATESNQLLKMALVTVSTRNHFA